MGAAARHLYPVEYSLHPAKSYGLCVGDETVGYGAVGGAPRDPKDTVKELYLRPSLDALPFFRELVRISGARRIEPQTNDPLLLLMLFDCGTDVTSETILFADGVTTTLSTPVAGAMVRATTDADRARLFPHTREPVGEWVLDVLGELVASGGLAFHYNPPYADIYMEVAASHQRRGLGSYLVQELKRAAYDMGCVPAARCHQDKTASRLTLQRAGMFPCARILKAHIVP